MKTKVIATIGPASARKDVIKALIHEGVHGLRINFAHGDPSSWEHYVNLIRKAEEELGTFVTLIGDLRGPSIRLGVLDEPLRFRSGDVLKIVNSEQGHAKDREIPLPNDIVFEGLDVGDVIIMDDGRVRLRVTDVGHDHIEVTALTDGAITSRKALVVQDKEFNLPTLTTHDLKVLDFIVKHGFNYVGLSYVRCAYDIEILRKELRRRGAKGIKVIAKIETRSAVKNLNEIVESTDVILVARGDLGMNYGLEEVPIIQRYIVSKSLSKGKPVIIATQLLESLTTNPVPNRSEVADVHEAVLEGVDALMLTNETSVGKYPIEAVRWIKKIIKEVEKEGTIRKPDIKPRTLRSRFAKGITELAESLGAKLLIFTMKGTTAFEISKFRPTVPVYAGANDLNVIKLINILWGIKPYLVKGSTYEEGLDELLKVLRTKYAVNVGDIVIQTYGLKDEELHIIKLRVVS
ncbi:MAG: pyruvate kinase [Thermoprotei archaeon]|nr:MAG: pyruvate kinase [Thermoprotei archaeon]